MFTRGEYFPEKLVAEENSKIPKRGKKKSTFAKMISVFEDIIYASSFLFQEIYSLYHNRV